MAISLHRIVAVLFCGFGFSLLLAGCANLISGNRPIPVKATDSTKFEDLLKIPRDAPFLPHQIGSKPVRIYKVAFDGTLNNRVRIPRGERETIVARIATLVRANDYQPGAGMQSEDIDNLDAMTGASCVRTAEEARDKFFSQVRKWLSEDPTTEIRVFVTGFSRGAATARHFMNIVTQEWGAQFDDKRSKSHSESPRFYALLYDTVATGQHDRLQLNVPTSVEYLVHFVAIDEPREILFTPTVDVDSSLLPVDFEFIGGSRLTPPKRINTVYLPGAHSDVGASFSDGIGDLYVVLAEQFLYMMGLTTTNCWDLHYDPFVSGKHDSRGKLDKLFGSPDPNSVKEVKRNSKEVHVLPPGQEEASMAKRLRELWLANADRMAGMSWSIQSMQMATIELRRSGTEIQPLGASNEIDFSSVQLKKIESQIRLEFRFKVGNAGSILILKPEVLNRILPEGSMISLTYLETPRSFSIAIFVDDVLADFIPMKKGEEIRYLPNRDHCVKRADGSSRTPFQAFVIHSDGTISTPFGPEIQ